MKIHSSIPVAPLLPPTRVAGVATARPAASSGSSVQVELSSGVARLREAARSAPHGEVRADVVAQARADIASGRLGSDADFDRAIDAFLREL